MRVRHFAAAPWHLSKRHRRMLETALQNLAPAEISVGRLYYDYKPANTVFDQDILHLIDPPDTLREGIHLWDVALFRSSMRRHLWRYTLRHPLARERRTAILAAIRAFQQSYVAALQVTAHRSTSTRSSRCSNYNAPGRSIDRQ